MVVREREDVRSPAVPLDELTMEWTWDDLPLSEDAGPPLWPPDDADDGHGGDDDADAEGHNTWGHRLFALLGIVVLLSMIVSPIAADLLAGHK